MRSSRFMSAALLSLALFSLLAVAPAFARTKIFTLSDPRGDDHGDGNLIYPLNDELDAGDLDLLSLTAYADDGGTWFEAEFAKPVKQPGAETVDDLGTTLKSVARFGFYTVNLDIYIDTDHVAGSGGVALLPGRFAEADRGSAWEKAIILTPRPHEARGEIKRILMRNLNEENRKDDSTMSDQESAALKAQIPGDVEERIFFPSQIRVRGNKISFFVPGSFLGGAAKDTWSYIVATSGANVLQSVDLNRVLGREAKQESLMILPISPGRWQDRFGGGRENAAIQPPLVDIIVPGSGRPQESVLQDFDSRSKRPVILPGVIPAEEAKKK